MSNTLQMPCQLLKYNCSAHKTILFGLNLNLLQLK